MAMTTNVSAPGIGSERTKTDLRAMSIATALFFLWGFLTSLNDILIPHLKGIFELSYAQALLVQFAFFSAYFVFALPSGKLVDWRGYKQTMVIGLVVMACGALLFLPASTAASFALFLTALVVLAAGITCLQVSANPYVTSLGPENTAASRLNFSQAFNSLGTFLAPLAGGALILGGTQMAPDKLHSLAAAARQAYRAEQASSVRLPYLGIALALLALAAALGLLKLPSASTNEYTQDFRPGELNEDKGSIWGHKWLLLGAMGIFVYVGAEVSIGSFLVNYFGLPQIMSMSEQTAAKYVSLYWLGAMIGRFIGSALLQKLRTGMVLGSAAMMACLLVLVSMATHGPTAMWAIISVGLFNSVMFPSIFTLGLANLGALTSKGSSLMVCAIVGGALLPLFEGFLADRVGVQHAFIVPVLCYVFIAFFGFSARNLMTSTEKVSA
ncbi:sugar MFS transporter [Granulicella tundricola]|uniref:Glucose/galactose transporter n=1 Tax=Granulicella tundricola (strain ATCC BAA-1859 / DSM 23138 / MP5ACTX9) TaxID=1198114 RepID=E8X657_GRATM|nr:sugar MFS transporter [Granulicella tundricola]ADW70941.1 glucose/galactose transporter [Granulicella tundricola MP5ACTX9]